ncbi:DUF5786 family protein [Halobacterium wangiae]|uniref:DUF5786 family protein n=1 Tax=Halobacterium wangiae TaxID=2902623 RepID=UPI001E2B7455|nr:DUF5786 family protein [Halobacterium wangiae]
MGFGSYDESEQDNQSLDSEDIDTEESLDTGEFEHAGDVSYEIGASNDELLDRLQDIKEQ